MHDWHAEDRHDSVADEFLHRPALTFEARSCSVEVARHHTAERLRVELLAEGRRAGHIGEQDSYRLTHLAACRGREPGAARCAEARPFSILLAAAWARQHAQERTAAARRSRDYNDYVRSALVTLEPASPCGEVAQLVEHTAENRGVAGSIPALATLLSFPG